MSCEQYREILSAMLDGEAAPDEVEACTAHVETCKDCAAYRDDLQEDRETLRAWPQEALPAPRGAGAVLNRWLAVAAALVLAFLAGRVTAPRSEPAPAATQVASAFRETERTIYPDSNEVHSYVTLRTGSARAAEGGQ